MSKMSAAMAASICVAKVAELNAGGIGGSERINMAWR